MSTANPNESQPAREITESYTSVFWWFWVVPVIWLAWVTYRVGSCSFAEGPFAPPPNTYLGLKLLITGTGSVIATFLALLYGRVGTVELVVFGSLVAYLTLRVWMILP